MDGFYHEGLVCLNGHAVAGQPASPDWAAFCSQCGSATISRCSSCNATIKGDWEEDGYGTLTSSDPETYCRGCGKPYPWTAAKMNAVSELSDAIEELTDNERSVLAELLPHLIHETPRTQPAGFKVAAIIGQLKGPGKAALRKILEEVAVEAGKKALGY